MNLKKLLQDKKTKNMIIIILAALILVIVLIVVLTLLLGGRTNSYSELETKLVTAAKSYYSSNSDRLPVEIGTSVEIDNTALTAGGYLKEMSKIQPKNNSCSGKVVVTNTNGSYNYAAYLDCGDNYKTISLSNQIIENTVIAVTGDGLYNNDGEYVYRGEKPNNYIKFAGRMYRIVDINEDGSVDIIATEKDKTTPKSVWDDRYNSERNSTSGINDYSLSRIKENLLEYVNGSKFTDKDRVKLVSHSVCVGKASDVQVVSRGIECASVIENQVIGLLTASEFAYASLDSTCKVITDKSCQNYNYLAGADYSWWTITADYENTYRSYMVDDGKAITSTRAAASTVIREVLRLSTDTIYVSGNGSYETPYIIK